MKPGSGGFSLIELLVVIAIIGILGMLLAVSMGSMMKRADQVSEISAAKDLMRGMAMYSNDHRGAILPGYKNDPAYDAEGKEVAHPLNARYPWRLAPYMDYKVEGALLAGPQRKARGRMASHDAFVYHTSLHPSLGMNVGYVGGDYSGGATRGALPIPAHFAKLGAFCVLRENQVVDPTQLMVFGSARGDQGKAKTAGYFKIEPPAAHARFKKNASASSFGFLDLRYDGRAVVAFFDGHVGTLNHEEALDMRHWNNLAGEANDPTFRPF